MGEIPAYNPEERESGQPPISENEAIACILAVSGSDSPIASIAQRICEKRRDGLFIITEDQAGMPLSQWDQQQAEIIYKKTIESKAIIKVALEHHLPALMPQFVEACLSRFPPHVRERNRDSIQKNIESFLTVHLLGAPVEVKESEDGARINESQQEFKRVVNEMSILYENGVSFRDIVRVVLKQDFGQDRNDMNVFDRQFDSLERRIAELISAIRRNEDNFRQAFSRNPQVFKDWIAPINASNLQQYGQGRSSIYNSIWSSRKKLRGTLNIPVPPKSPPVHDQSANQYEEECTEEMKQYLSKLFDYDQNALDGAESEKEISVQSLRLVCDTILSSLYHDINHSDPNAYKLLSTMPELKNLLTEAGLSLVPIDIGKTPVDSRIHQIIQTKRAASFEEDGCVLEVISPGLQLYTADGKREIIRKPVVIRGEWTVR